MGLLARKDHRPGELSGGGTAARGGRARSCVPVRRLLLADEPSGNLDRETGERLHDLLRELNREEGLTIVVVTHNERLAASAAGLASR